MEQETLIAGYCRRMDQSRMVMVVTEDGRLVEADCDFGTCPYESGCTVACRICQMCTGENQA